MIKKRTKENMYLADHGWLLSRFHFSFAEYYNPDNMNFGVLRVLNDDIIRPNSGFDMHPHKNMEIISYVVSGELTHQDSLGYGKTLKRGDVQYMSAGKGVVHAEYNKHSTKNLRLLQIWILPNEQNLEPFYTDELYSKTQNHNKLLCIVSKDKTQSDITIHQDVDIYVCELDDERELLYEISQDRQIYFVQIEGTSQLNGITLHEGDAAIIVDEVSVKISARTKSHFLFIQMKK